MLQADIYNFHKVEYIVIDTAAVTMDMAGLVKLGSYRQGVGADRILLVDKSLGQLIAAVNAKGGYELLSVDDYQIANVAFGKADKPAEMHHRELHVTEYFLQQIAQRKELVEIAG